MLLDSTATACGRLTFLNDVLWKSRYMLKLTSNRMSNEKFSDRPEFGENLCSDRNYIIVIIVGQ
jgi:hypothetical protein